MSPTNSHIEPSMPNAMVFGDRTFGRVVGLDKILRMEPSGQDSKKGLTKERGHGKREQ